MTPRTLEGLHVQWEAAATPAGRAKASHRARLLASRLGVAAPTWAEVRTQRAGTLSLDELRERHDRGGTPDRLARLRQLARERAPAAGVAVPAWATKTCRSLAMPDSAELAGKPPDEASTAAPVQPSPAPSTTFVRAPPSSPPRPAAAPVEMPTQLSAWRSAGVARVVQIREGRVILHELCQPPRTFASVNDAIAAVG